MPRFCNNCGAPLKDGALFCTNCGTRIIQQGQPAQPAGCNNYQNNNPNITYQNNNQQGYAQQPYSQPGYVGQMPYQQPPKKKNGCGKVALIVILVVLAVLGIGGYFLYKAGKGKIDELKTRIEETLEQSTSEPMEIEPEKVEKPKKAETPAENPQMSMGTGKVKVKNAEFFGVPLPIPDFGTVTEYTTEPKGNGYEAITIRIDGISYQEFIEYCKQLETIDGWKSMRHISMFPEDYNDETMVEFTGFYRAPLTVCVYYLSDYYRGDTGWPNFQLQLINY